MLPWTLGSFPVSLALVYVAAVTASGDGDDCRALFGAGQASEHLVEAKL